MQGRGFFISTGYAVSYRNQLEPDTLVSQFIHHPPEGFSVSSVTGNAPAFCMNFDLLTTMEPALQQKILHFPLYRFWGKLLRFFSCFVGTTVSEYVLLPEAVSASEFAFQLKQTQAKRYPFLIVKDIPFDSPLLSKEDNAYSRQFADELEKQGFLIVEGQALAWLPVDYSDETDYLGRLSGSRRKDLKRKLKKRSDVEVRILSGGDPSFDESETLEQYYRLYLNVFNQSEIHFDLLSKDFFRGLLQDKSAGTVIFTYHRENSLIGYNICFVRNGVLIDKYIGLEYPAARECNLYFLSWFENLNYALEKGLKTYVAGWTDPEIKSYLGARFTFTRHAVYIRNPVLRFVLSRFKRLFENDSQWQETAKSIKS